MCCLVRLPRGHFSCVSHGVFRDPTPFKGDLFISMCRFLAFYSGFAMRVEYAFRMYMPPLDCKQNCVYTCVYGVQGELSRNRLLTLVMSKIVFCKKNLLTHSIYGLLRHPDEGADPGQMRG